MPSRINSEAKTAENSQNVSQSETKEQETGFAGTRRVLQKRRGGKESKNDPNKLRKMRLMKFVSAATKIILRIRADKRLGMIRSYLGQARNREEVQKLVQDDWQKADYMGAKGGERDVKFEFDFNEVNVGGKHLYIQYDNKIDQINEKYNATPTIGFDDLSHINDLKFNDAELLDYKPLNPFAIHMYHPVMTDATYREGAEYEYPIPGKLGPSGDLTKDPDHKIIFKPLPNNLLLPPDIESHRCLYPPPKMR